MRKFDPCAAQPCNAKSRGGVAYCRKHQLRFEASRDPYAPLPGDKHVILESSSGVGFCFVCGPETRLVFRSHRGNWVCSNLTRRQAAVNHLRREYGISEEQYRELVSYSGGHCNICGTREERLVVDHDHSNGLIRGMLCDMCNRGLGHFRDDEELLNHAIRYLKTVHFRNPDAYGVSDERKRHLLTFESRMRLHPGDSGGS